MSQSRTLIRSVITGVAAIGAVALAAAPAMAHHCYVPMYSLNSPASPNWFVATAEFGAAEVGYTAGCQEAVDAGYAALRAEGLPLAIKIFTNMTIGDPNHTGRMNPNGANGKGLEYFEAGSTLGVEMVETWTQGAQSVTCDAG